MAGLGHLMVLSASDLGDHLAQYVVSKLSMIFFSYLELDGVFYF